MVTASNQSINRFHKNSHLATVETNTEEIGYAQADTNKPEHGCNQADNHSC